MAKARIGVLISGRGSNMAALLYASRQPDCPYEIALVASNDPDAPGLALATAEGIATFARSHKGLKRAEFDAIIDAELRAADVSHVALAGYMRLLSPEFVARWEGRMVNIHPSLLPKYQGLDTHRRAIEAGDTVTGCTVHIVTAELDDGPALGRTEVVIMPDDTPESLAARVLIAEHQLYPAVLMQFVSGTTTPHALLERARASCLSLPDTSEKISHGIPAFAVAGKMFAYFRNNHHGDAMVSLCLKTTGREEQDMLIENDPDLFSWPAYLGPSGWVAMRLDQSAIDWTHVEDRILMSWRLAAPRKLADVL